MTINKHICSWHVIPHAHSGWQGLTFFWNKLLFLLECAALDAAFNLCVTGLASGCERCLINQTEAIHGLVNAARVQASRSAGQFPT